MPAFTGATRDQRPTDRPYLSVLVFGTAPLGAVGESRWFADAQQAAFAYGGATVARLSPNPTQTSITLDADFAPDDPSLSLDSRTVLYHCNPATGRPVEYLGMGNRTASGMPVTVDFDAIGYDPSVQYYDGGLFLEAAGYARHGLSGDILLPLMSALQEVGGDGQSLLNVGGCRVGASWQPPKLASVSIPFPTSASGQPVVGAYAVTEQGNGSASDPVLTVTASLTSTSLIVDPGTLGLPYTRMTYPFAAYATWNDLWDSVQRDYDGGHQPLRMSVRAPRNSAGAKSAPTAPASPQAYPVSYGSFTAGSPDLTTAAGWVRAFATDDLPLDECPFLVLAGLTGEALAEDTESAVVLMTLIDQSAEGNDENPEITLILPWSLTPPPAGTVYDPTPDADAMFNLADALGDQLASRLLVFWGGITQTGLPPSSGGGPLQIPVAYAAAGALVREGSGNATGPTSNLMHPPINSVVSSYVPPLLIKAASEVASPALPTSVPSPDTLETLRVSGISALTRSVGGAWRMYGPILMGNGDPWRVSISEAVVRERVQRNLDQYLGRSNDRSTRDEISKTLQAVVSDIQNNADAVSRQISDITLTLAPTNAQETQILVALQVEGQLTLYGETSVISFQVSLQR